MFTVCSELTFPNLPSCRIWSEKWFRRSIFTTLKSDSFTRCCAISASLCVVSWSMRQSLEATIRLFLAVSLSGFSYMVKVSHCFNASGIFLKIYSHGNDWNHSSDNDTPPDDSLSTWLWPQYCTSTAPWGKNKYTSWRKIEIVWRESFVSPKALKTLLWKLVQSHTWVLSSLYHSIVSSSYMACWIELSQDMEALTPRAGWICRYWNVVWGRRFPSSWNA